MNLITSISVLLIELQFLVHIFGAELGVENTTRAFRRGTTNSVADFKELVTCATYVDKTEMIEDFFENSAAREYQLITCPHKFGKTVNIDMMKRFVEGGVALTENNTVIKQRLQENYDLFHYSEQKFKISSILKNNCSFYRDNFQQYSVIHVTFKVTGANSYDGMITALWENFKRNFQSYQALWSVLLKKFSIDSSWEIRYNVPVEFKTMCRVMKRVFRPPRRSNDDPENIVTNALYELSRAITMFYPYSKIFLFIDDYDDPIINAMENNYDVTRVMKFIDAIFSTLFNHHHRNIQHALITGTLNVLDRKKFSSIKHWKFLHNHHFAQYFGLTEDEVDGLIDLHNGNAEDKKLLKEYYEGYHVPRTSARIFNPYSIANYLASRNPNDARVGLQNYWAESGDDSKFFECLQKNKMNKELISELLAMKNVTFALKKNWDVKDLEGLRTVLHKHDSEMTSLRADLVLSYLFHRGYLSREERANAFSVLHNEKLRASMNLLGPLSEKNVILDKDKMRKKLSGDLQ